MSYSMIRNRIIHKKSQNKFIQYKSNRTSIIGVITIFFLIALLSVVYIDNVQKLTYKNVYQNITELSEQTATQLNLAITDQMSVIHLMVEYVNKGHLTTEEEIFDSFRDQLDNYHFTRLVILDKEGNGVTSDGYSVKNYENIEEFFVEEHVYLSENRPSTVTDDQVNIYAHVFKLNGEDRVLMATIKTSEYKELLLRRLFGKGGTYLINSEGTVLIDSFDNIKDSSANLYEYIKNTYNVVDKEKIQVIDDMARAIKENQEGTFDIRFGRENFFVHYEKLNINDWYVVTSASDSTIASELMNLVILSTILCLIITFVIVSISIYISITNQNKNRKIYRVAYIDPITLLGNETYFKGNGSIYLEGQTSNLKYIITVDINKFKALNNIHGYAFCNEILKKLGNKLTEILPPNNITCRVSNDVFASIFSYEDDINDLLNKIYEEASVLTINDINIHLNLAIGAYNILPNDTDINKILDKAYLARSQIKGLYNQNYYLFDEKLENQLVEEQMLESSMDEALKNNEFKVVYQPKTYTSNEKMSGAEALVRWHKGDQVISPRKIYTII